ncbi:Fc.00g097890.m01.CDS01 [Cosmosporella sp. VM-42]
MGFLEIPIEIREQILSEFLDISKAECPINPTSAINDRKPLPHKHIFFKKMQNPTVPLLLANKQLFGETKGLLSRKRSQRANYAIDIMYVKNSGLWSTWLSAPFLTTDIGTVHTTFRLFNQPNNLPSEMNFPNMWRGGDGGPPSGVWIFYHMITQFLDQKIGPWPLRAETEAETITVQRLVLDVLTPVEPDILSLAAFPHRPGHDWMDRARRTRNESKGLPAQVFADFIKREIGGLLCMGYYTTGYGDILHERFGIIEIRVGGEPYHSWDVSEIFSKLPLNDDQWGTFSMAERKASYRKWKLEAAEKRRRAGFRLIEEDETRSW